MFTAVRFLVVSRRNCRQILKCDMAYLDIPIPCLPVETKSKPRGLLPGVKRSSYLILASRGKPAKRVGLADLTIPLLFQESRTCLSRSLLLLLCLHGLAAAETWPASGDKPTARCRNERRSEANLLSNHVIIYLAHDESRSLLVRLCGNSTLGPLATSDRRIRELYPLQLCIYLQLQLF
jgi:hypothetical protein